MQPDRRMVLASALAVALSPGLATAHTPFRQWVVYRQKHLLVGAHRGDAQTYVLAQAVVVALGEELPDARARVARGPRAQRIAKLMSTGQLLLAVLPEAEAMAMSAAATPFENYVPISLTRIAAIEADYSLFAAPDLPASHAWLVADALVHAGLAEEPEDLPIALHPGARAFWRGDPKPG